MIKVGSRHPVPTVGPVGKYTLNLGIIRQPSLANIVAYVVATPW